MSEKVSQREYTIPGAPQTKTATATSSDLIAYNAARSGFWITNLSSADWIFLGEATTSGGSVTAEVNKGKAIGPGQTWVMDDSNLHPYKMTIIGSVASVACSYSENTEAPGSGN